MKREAIQNGLSRLIGDGKVSTSDSILSARSHDYWLLDLQRRLHGGALPKPACVVTVENGDDVSAVLRFATANGVAVVPYGAGSGVCGGARATEGVITLDMRTLNRVLELDGTALTVKVQPGMLGSDFEAYLNAHGYSMGHFPQSMRLSSVGGWVATRASGQFSTKYGSIEDMLVCLEGYLADGTYFSTRNAPRSAAGPNINELILGSEGTLAVITSVTYKIHPLPEKQAMNSFQFDSFDAGLEAIRRIMRAGWTPALVRLYDAVESKRHFGNSGVGRGKHVLLLLSEGPERLADVEIEECSRIASTYGGSPLGPDPVSHWLNKRFDVPDVEELATKKGVVFDTIEISANWNRVGKLYQDAVAALSRIPGIVNASAHSSHSYQQGTCLYFTFAVKKPKWIRRQIARLAGWKDVFVQPEDLPAVEEIYRAGWSAVMEATRSNGGTISHHHGIGKVRLPWVEAELGSSLNILRAVKAALDPAGVLNPGTLILGKGGSDAKSSSVASDD